MTYDPKEQNTERRDRYRREDREDIQHGINMGWFAGPQLAVLTIAMIALLAFGVFQVRSWLLPAEEALRRDVYEESKSYRDGTVRDLDNLMLQWAEAEGVARGAIGEIALHRSADFPDDALPERLREWLGGLRSPND